MPLTHITAYHRPGEVATAWQLLRDGGDAVRVVSGVSDLPAACPPHVHELVDLAGLDLHTIAVSGDGGVRIGALATFTDLLEHPSVAAHAGGVLAEMLLQASSLLHRNGATIGRHVARGGLSDVSAVLLALDARIAFYDGAEQERSLHDYDVDERGPRIVTAVTLPALAQPSAAAFVRFSRAATERALVNGCCRAELDSAGAVAAARVVVSDTGVRVRRIPDAEGALEGSPLAPGTIAAAADAARAAANPRSDWAASAEYRRHLVGVTVERCLAAVAERLDGGAA